MPSFFRISEPAIFGAPIIFNPILMIPFVLGGMISALLYWGAISLGLVSNFYILVSGTFPIYVQGFIQCLDPRTGRDAHCKSPFRIDQPANGLLVRTIRTRPSHQTSRAIR